VYYFFANTGLNWIDSSQLDFRNPEAFYHDVNSVAGLLKQFFRDLPDPLLTREHYDGFIEAARKSSFSFWIQIKTRIEICDRH